MHAINRKLLRDCRRLWAQVLAVALVLACGVAVPITSFSKYHALDKTRATSYEPQRFADAFDATRRARVYLLGDIAAILGRLREGAGASASRWS